MKRGLLIISLVLAAAASGRAFDISCSPTTPVANQIRTDMKHRRSAIQSVSIIQTSVAGMLNWPNPISISRSNGSIDQRENIAYTIVGDLWRVIVEGNDCDFHLELTSPGNGRDADRVIIEVPQGPAFTSIRDNILQSLANAGQGHIRVGKSVELQQSIPVQATGYAFFDSFHYSSSNPKRGHGHGTAMVGTIWELHPVWSLSLGNAPPATITSTNIGEQPGPNIPANTTSAPQALDNPELTAYDFAISKSFLQTLEQNHTIQPIFTLQLGNHSGIHRLDADCEMHIAAMPQQGNLGSPEAVIVEPPNLCEMSPSGDQSGSTQGWIPIFDNVNGKTCRVTGFPRIFTEHATGSSGPSNPNHVFEVHPALAINCEAQNLTFSNFLKVFPGMRAISPSTTASCVADRQLEVRSDSNNERYLFRESGGKCGNFAIVEVDNIVGNSVRSVGGGHSAIARVSPDGQSIVTLKLYTLAPSEIDNWLAGLSNSSPTPNMKLVHGLFTYDYFAFQKLLHPRGGEWRSLPDWTNVNFPLALVVFGEAQSAPWSTE